MNIYIFCLVLQITRDANLLHSKNKKHIRTTKRAAQMTERDGENGLMLEPFL